MIESDIFVWNQANQSLQTSCCSITVYRKIFAPVLFTPNLALNLGCKFNSGQISKQFSKCLLARVSITHCALANSKQGKIVCKCRRKKKHWVKITLYTVCKRVLIKNSSIVFVNKALKNNEFWWCYGTVENISEWTTSIHR